MRYEFDNWAEDENGWDVETTAPGIWLFGNAVQVWSVFQNRSDVSVADAAAAFNCDPLRIIEAVEEAPWMFLSGPHDDFSRLMIEHEGE